MQTMQNGARSLSLIFELNRDRALYCGAIAGSLVLAYWLAGSAM